MAKFNYVSCFSGIGGFEQALNKLGGHCVMASEIDKYANQAYEALYGHETVGDITKVDAKDVPDHDLLVGGFPCQSFSVAGKRGGFEDARGTMFFEMARIAAEKKPKVILAENVKGLVGHDKGKTLDTIVHTLNQCGYRVDFNVLNSKYFGVPQNRERIFLIGIRDDLIPNEPWTDVKGSKVVPKGKRRISGYEDIKTFNFDWPEQTEVTTRLVDVLEPKVDERYYLSEEKTAALVAQLDEKDKEDAPNVVHNIYGGFDEKKPRVFKDVSPTIRTSAGGGHLPSLLEDGLPIREATATGYAVACEGDAVNFRFPNSKTRRGRVGKQMANTLEASGISQGVVEPLDASMREGRTKVREDGVSSALTDSYHKGLCNQERPFVGVEVRPVLTPDRLNKRQNGRRFKEDGEESFTLTSQDRHGVAISEVRPTALQNGNMQGRRIKGDGDPSFTVSATDRHGVTLGNYPKYRIRKLTPLECFRLQGFSDEAHQTLVDAGISNTQLYKQAGNAVTVNVIEALGERLLPYLTKSDEAEAN